MDHIKITKELDRNRLVFKDLLSALSKEMYTFKPSPEKWCILEVVCHLYDEEREDFRLRTRQVLKNPEKTLPSFDPLTWVNERNYLEQDYELMLSNFLKEREKSIIWLEKLENPDWKNSYVHPKLGAMSAAIFLANWLAHDYLHLRQITKLKYDYVQAMTNENLTYAGTWI
ncbi:DinB family protein [Namhaeicola litoreus]|uniref:DinB family protein n=1 Tax=Namhaeicola litoreus TaxID=1052145 RepID=A0ABW3XXW6_9FLAO